MERFDAAARALRDAVLDAHHDGGPMIALHHAAGHDAHHAAMPAFAPENQRRLAIGHRRFEAALQNLMHDGALGGLALLVQRE